MGGVIRREDVRGSPAFSFPDVERQAAEIIARANAEAARLMAEGRRLADDVERRLRAESEEQRRAGYQAGLTQGRAEGSAQVQREARQAAVAAAQAELQRLTDALRSGLAEYERNRRGLIATAESGLVELAVAVARRVCKTWAAASVAPARANVRAVLELVKHHDDLELHLHPDEIELLREVVPALAQQAAELTHVTLTADATVARGGCVLRTRDGVVDASLETQLDRIAAAICAADERAPDTPPPPVASDEVKP